ncbi:hypothetical protein BWZ22_10185 [Seonamhaeicola sp. S2-3]|uniref:DUF4340 domain-containing protein n=1 Tax=Seonamhaeicola sp. S2-3 TaxID=1936081 RepID=UPI000972750D|nr:DUF4340 domain-containing protein [Seonamhaeicola sp. S2-3]APY11586.1 hypothetical protein BWZ22_10185 [Seonamhaeicola sp. S2-3]
MKKNKILIAILVGLVLLFVATNYFKKTSKVNFKAEVVRLDASQISKITIRPPSTTNEEAIVLSKDNQMWHVEQGQVKTQANQLSVKNTLDQLEAIETQQLVAKTKDKWGSYGLVDSLAQCIEIQEQGKQEPTKVYLGKTVYKESGSTTYGRRTAVNGVTYFRVNNDPQTYALKSGITSIFKRKFNAWRNTEFLKVDREQITQLKLESKDNKGFLLSKKGTDWDMEGKSPDSTKVAQYLNRLRYQSSSQFVDGFVPKPKADYQLTIQGDSIESLIVRAYQDSTGHKFILNSSQHPDVFVESDSTGLFKRLFVNQEHFF